MTHTEPDFAALETRLRKNAELARGRIAGYPTTTLIEAADAICTLQTRIKSILSAEHSKLARDIRPNLHLLEGQVRKDMTALCDENDALQARIAELVKESKTDPYMTELTRLQAENVALHAFIIRLIPTLENNARKRIGKEYDALAKENHGK